jgi:hypothetical protein
VHAQFPHPVLSSKIDVAMPQVMFAPGDARATMSTHPSWSDRRRHHTHPTPVEDPSKSPSHRSVGEPAEAMMDVDDKDLQPVDLATSYTLEIGDLTQHLVTGTRVTVTNRLTVMMDDEGIIYSVFFLRLHDEPS